MSSKEEKQLSISDSAEWFQNLKCLPRQWQNLRNNFMCYATVNGITDDIPRIPQKENGLQFPGITISSYTFDTTESSEIDQLICGNPTQQYLFSKQSLTKKKNDSISSLALKKYFEVPSRRHKYRNRKRNIKKCSITDIKSMKHRIPSPFLKKIKTKSQISANSLNTSSTCSILSASKTDMLKKKMQKQNWIIPEDLSLLIKAIKKIKQKREKETNTFPCTKSEILLFFLLESNFKNTSDCNKSCKKKHKNEIFEDKRSVALQSSNTFSDIINQFDSIFNYVWKLFLIKLAKSIYKFQKIKDLRKISTSVSNTAKESSSEQGAASSNISVNRESSICIEECLGCNDVNNCSDSCIQSKSDGESDKKTKRSTLSFLKKFKSKKEPKKSKRFSLFSKIRCKKSKSFSGESLEKEA